MYKKLLNDNLNNPVGPSYVYLTLSNLCNAHCKFCEVHNEEVKKSSLDFKKVISDLAALGVEYIHFTGGGEPFVNPEIWELLDLCSSLGIKTVFTTNGMALNENLVKRLVAYEIPYIIFSLDSSDAKVHDELRGVSGTWLKATQSISLVKKHLPNTKVVINTVMNAENIDGFKELLEYVKQNNIDYVNPLLIKDTPNMYPSLEQLKSLKKVLSEETDKHIFLPESTDYLVDDENVNDGSRRRNAGHSCQVLNQIAFIDGVSGGVYPCDCSVHRDTQIYQLGNLYQDPFAKIWLASRRSELLTMLDNGELACKYKCDEVNVNFSNYIRGRK